MYTCKQNNPKYSNQKDREIVKGLYKQDENFKISLNDQLEVFYSKCLNNRFRKHEVIYFFHAESFSSHELEDYQTNHGSELPKTSFNQEG